MPTVTQIMQLAGQMCVDVAPRSYIFEAPRRVGEHGYCAYLRTCDGSIMVPIVWSDTDIERCDTEKKTCDFVHGLMKNAIQCVDDMLIEAGRRG